jgi:ribonuclease I
MVNDDHILAQCAVCWIRSIVHFLLGYVCPSFDFHESSLLQPTLSPPWSITEHEWTKHGTCTGSPQQQYFQNALNVLNKIGTPSRVSENVGKTISAADLRNDFGGSAYVSLQCSSGQFLAGAYLCIAQSNGQPGAQTKCGADVVAEDTCTMETITINTF